MANFDDLFPEGGRVSPTDQRGRDSDALAILKQERQKSGNSQADNDALDREIARVSGQPVPKSPTMSSAPSPTMVKAPTAQASNSGVGARTAAGMNQPTVMVDTNGVIGPKGTKYSVTPDLLQQAHEIGLVASMDRNYHLDQPSDTKMTRGESALQGASNGGTLGGSNYIGAAMADAWDTLKGTKGDMQYKDYLQAARTNNQQAAQDNPGSYIAGNIAGSVATIPFTGGFGTVKAGAGAGRAVATGLQAAGVGAKTARVVGTTVGNAATGAAMGGITAANNSNAGDYSTILPGAGMGAVAGAVLPPVIQAAGKGIQYGAQKVGQAAAPVVESVANATGLGTNTAQAQAAAGKLFNKLMPAYNSVIDKNSGRYISTAVNKLGINGAKEDIAALPDSPQNNNIKKSWQFVNDAMKDPLNERFNATNTAKALTATAADKVAAPVIGGIVGGVAEHAVLGSSGTGTVLGTMAGQAIKKGVKSMVTKKITENNPFGDPYNMKDDQAGRALRDFTNQVSGTKPGSGGDGGPTPGPTGINPGGRIEPTWSSQEQAQGTGNTPPEGRQAPIQSPAAQGSQQSQSSGIDPLAEPASTSQPQSQGLPTSGQRPPQGSEAPGQNQVPTNGVQSVPSASQSPVVSPTTNVAPSGANASPQGATFAQHPDYQNVLNAAVKSMRIDKGVATQVLGSLPADTTPEAAMRAVINANQNKATLVPAPQADQAPATAPKTSVSDDVPVLTKPLRLMDRENGDGTFTKVTIPAGVKPPNGPGMMNQVQATESTTKNIAGQPGVTDVYARFPGDPTSYVSYTRMPDGSLTNFNIKTSGMGKNMGAQVAANVMKTQGDLQPPSIETGNIINKPTLDSMDQGANYSDTVLGQLKKQIGAQLGGTVDQSNLISNGMGKYGQTTFKYGTEPVPAEVPNQQVSTPVSAAPKFASYDDYLKAFDAAPDQQTKVQLGNAYSKQMQDAQAANPTANYDDLFPEQASGLQQILGRLRNAKSNN